MTRGLVDAGISVTIITTGQRVAKASKESPKPKESQEVTCLYFRRTTGFYKTSFAMRGWLKRHIGEFDLVHVHALFSYSSIAAAKAARDARVPYIVRPLGVLNRWGMENRRRRLKRLSLRWIELPLLRDAAAIHFTSQAERKEALISCPELASIRSVVIPLPVEIPPVAGLTPEKFATKFPSIRGREVVLFLSRTDRKKGLELLVEAFTQISRRFSSALLVIAGAGDNAHEMELRARAETLGISGDMVWTGFLGPEDKANALGAATVFVLPSYSENFGIAAAEAMAAGVPTILSEGVAIAEYSVASQAALIVPPQAKAIADALELVLKDRELRKRLSNNGRALCQERFSVNAVGMALKDLYDSVLDAAGRPTANS